MVRYCSNCGAQTDKSDKFCLNCGANLQTFQPTPPTRQTTAQTQPSEFKTSQQQPMSQQSYGQTPGYIPPQPKKSYAKIIGALIGFIAIVIILIILFLFVFKGTSDEAAGDQLIGTWEVTSMKMDNLESPIGNMDISFNSDGSYSSVTSGITSIGNWEIKDNKLYITTSESDSSSFGNIGLDYSFSGSNTVTLFYSGLIPGENDQSHTIQIVLVKKGSSNGNQNNNQSGNEETLKFIGTWNYNDSILGNVVIYINSDHSLVTDYYGIPYEFGTWSFNNGDICLTTDVDIFETGSEETTQCFSYTFTNEDKTLTLTAPGIEDIVLTK